MVVRAGTPLYLGQSHQSPSQTIEHMMGSACVTFARILLDKSSHIVNPTIDGWVTKLYGKWGNEEL